MAVTPNMKAVRMPTWTAERVWPLAFTVHIAHKTLFQPSEFPFF
jgi:hypothetical protein